MTITSQPSLSSLSTSIQQFLQAINEYGVSFDDLNSLIGTKSNNLIAIMDNIDAKTTGATTIYTVPSGKRLVITNVFIIPETITLLVRLLLFQLVQIHQIMIISLR